MKKVFSIFGTILVTSAMLISCDFKYKKKTKISKVAVNNLPRNMQEKSNSLANSNKIDSLNKIILRQTAQIALGRDVANPEVDHYSYYNAAEVQEINRVADSLAAAERVVQLNYNLTKQKEDEIFTFAEVMPDFSGKDGFQSYLKKNVRYPFAEKDQGKQGTVYVSFVIEKDGTIANVKAAKEVEGAPGFTKEAIRLISIMPKWTPGMMNGYPVRIEITQPVRFTLQ